MSAAKRPVPAGGGPLSSKRWIVTLPGGHLGLNLETAVDRFVEDLTH